MVKFPDSSTRNEWEALAKSHLDLRFPVVSLKVHTPFSYNRRGMVSFETLVNNKEGDLLVVVRDNYEISPRDNIFDVLQVLRERFNDKCILIKTNHIFTIDTAIVEPNKLKN